MSSSVSLYALHKDLLDRPIGEELKQKLGPEFVVGVLMREYPDECSGAKLIRMNVKTTGRCLSLYWHRFGEQAAKRYRYRSRPLPSALRKNGYTDNSTCMARVSCRMAILRRPFFEDVVEVTSKGAMNFSHKWVKYAALAKDEITTKILTTKIFNAVCHYGFNVYDPGLERDFRLFATGKVKEEKRKPVQTVYGFARNLIRLPSRISDVEARIEATLSTVKEGAHGFRSNKKRVYIGLLGKAYKARNVKFYLKVAAVFPEFSLYDIKRIINGEDPKVEEDLAKMIKKRAIKKDGTPKQRFQSKDAIESGRLALRNPYPFLRGRTKQRLIDTKRHIKRCYPLPIQDKVWPLLKAIGYGIDEKPMRNGSGGFGGGLMSL